MRYKKKPKSINNDIIIIYDDRENNPWPLPWTMQKKRLKVGDYSILGCENIIAIEKKSGFQELFSNLTGKERPRFERFLKRLSKYPVKCIIVEDEMSSLHSVWSIMRKKAVRMKLTPSTIFYWIGRIIVRYQIPILFIPKGWGHRIIKDIFVEAIKQCTSIKK